MANWLTRTWRRIAPLASQDQYVLLDLLRQRGTSPRRGTIELLDAYRTSPWLRAVTHRIASDVASVKWHLYETQGTERREITNHPLLQLWKRPNPAMTGRTMRQLTQILLDLKGEAFWLKERNAFGQVVQIYPIPPHWILETPSLNQPYFRGSHGTWQAFIHPNDIIWFRDVDPLRPYERGVGIGESLADELDTDEFIAKRVKSFFFNGAVPEVIVSVKGGEDQIQRMKTEWENSKPGFQSSFKTFWTKGEISVNRLDMSFKDQMLPELRKLLRDIVVNTYGLPPECLGIIENSNRATIDGAEYLKATLVVVPRLNVLQEEGADVLCAEFGGGLVFEPENVVPADKAFQLSVMQARPEVFEENEFRELAGKPRKSELDGKMAQPAAPSFGGLPMLSAGDPAPVATTDPASGESVQDTALNGAQVSSMIEVITAVATGQLPRDTGVSILMVAFQLTKEQADEIMGDVGQGFEPAAESTDQQVSLALRRAQRVLKARGVTKILPAWAPNDDPPWARTLSPRKRQQSLTAKDIDHLVSKLDPTLLSGPAADLLREQLQSWGANILKQLGADAKLDALLPYVEAYIKEFIRVRIGQLVNGTTQEQIAEEARKGIDLEETDEQIIGRIEKVFDDAVDNRSELIARTELPRAASKTAVDAYKASEVVEGKQWVSQLDDDTRPEHLALNGAIVGLDDKFTTDGHSALCPGMFGDKSLDCNCRCYVLPVPKEGRALRLFGVALTRAASTEELAAAQRAYDKALIPLETRMVAALRKGFRAQQKAFVEALKNR